MSCKSSWLTEGTVFVCVLCCLYVTPSHKCCWVGRRQGSSNVRVLTGKHARILWRVPTCVCVCASLSLSVCLCLCLLCNCTTSGAFLFLLIQNSHDHWCDDGGAQDIDAIMDSQPVPQPKAKKARPPKKKQLEPPSDPTLTPTPTQASSSAAAPGPTPTPGISSQGARAVQEMEVEVDQGGAVGSESADDRGFAMPKWLATKYDSTTVSPTPPSDSPANPSRPATIMAASSFKPKRRKKKAPVVAADPPVSDSQASDTHTPAQPARRGFFDEYVPYSWEEEDDTGGQTLEAGDLSPRGVDRDPRLTPEADDVIDAGVASVSPSVTQAESGSGRQQPGGIPNPPSIASGELSDVDVSLEGYEGIASHFHSCSVFVTEHTVLLLLKLHALMHKHS